MMVRIFVFCKLGRKEINLLRLRFLAYAVLRQCCKLKGGANVPGLPTFVGMFSVCQVYSKPSTLPERAQTYIWIYNIYYIWIYYIWIYMDIYNPNLKHSKTD